MAIHIATNRVKERRRSTHRPPWQIPEVHKPKRYFYVELHRVGCTGITNIALPGGGLSSGFHVSRKMPLGKIKSKLLAVKNGMQNPWPARPILRVRQAVPHRRTGQLANSLTNASSGWTAWPARTVHLGLQRNGDSPGISNLGCIAEGYGSGRSPAFFFGWIVAKIQQHISVDKHLNVAKHINVDTIKCVQRAGVTYEAQCLHLG